MLKILLPILLFANVCHAQMKDVASSYRSFDGGLNTYSASVALAPNESPNLLNVSIDEIPNALTQRKGYTACGNTPSGATATALYEYSKNDGSRRLIVSDNDTIWQTGDCINYSTIATNLGSLNLPRFATVQDNLWIVNGSTYPIVWNGTTGYYLDGASNRPLGPKGKLITYWKSRVWIGNTTQSPSGLYFSALVDAQGNIMDPATSTNAWSNALNLIYFNRDNGSPLYGIKVYRDNLYAFKENDILRLVFESEYTASGITVTKTVSKTGSKFQESIVEMDDGLLRFVGRDGVYAFDGSMVKRISTKWTPTFYTIKQPTHGEQYALWDSASDWNQGSMSSISTSPYPGSISLSLITSTYSVFDTFSDGNYTSSPVWTVGVGVTWSVSSGRLNFTGNNASAYIYSSTATYHQGRWHIEMPVPHAFATERYYFISNSANPISNSGYGIEIDYISGTSSSVKLFKSISGTISYILTIYPSASTFIGDVARDENNKFTVYSSTNGYLGQVTDVDVLENSSYQIAYCKTSGSAVCDFDNIYLTSGYSMSGIYTSQISTATGLTLWKTFDTDQTTPSSTTITYQVRVASTVYNLGLASYASIVSGSIVSASTNTFYQWKANLATTDNGVTPILNSASVGWVTGDSSKSPLTALAYKSRYWLAASVGLTNSYNDMTMVESKSPLMTYTKYDLPLSAMTLWNDNLYGAIGNTSKIVRVDYGDTDDGTAITSWWDSVDDVYNNPVVFKSINRQIADFAATPANSNLQIGLSSDFGATWQYRAVNTAVNPSLIRNTSVLNLDANNALQFRSRVFNNTSGVGYTLYGLHSLGSASDFMGNQ